MTQESRTTETMNPNYGAMRDIMVQIRDRLTVPERATLAVGLVGHLATLMNGKQMERLLDQLREESERVRDVPASRRREKEDRGEERRFPGAAA
ncbi:MAG TPA: hypothetical protein VNZ57_04730 [Longimicrobiales bacterium]|nr:hypothetical protein [Longimicrobiales bacterium]